MTIKGRKYISLKEAAELSGYTQDYLGQLIRGGKLPGKKVYVNVAWMTTEEDLEAYMQGAKNGNGSTKKNGNGGRANGRRAASPAGLTKPMLYFIAGFLGAAVFVLFYVFAVNLDTRLEDRAVEQAQGSVPEMMEELTPPQGGFEGF